MRKHATTPFKFLFKLFNEMIQKHINRTFYGSMDAIVMCSAKLNHLSISPYCLLFPPFFDLVVVSHQCPS